MKRCKMKEEDKAREEGPETPLDSGPDAQMEQENQKGKHLL